MIDPTEHRYRWQRRRAAASRMMPTACGHHTDPWLCRCRDHHREPDPDLTAAIAVHLLGTTGGPGMGHDADAARLLWRRGGPAARLAEQINALGGVAA